MRRKRFTPNRRAGTRKAAPFRPADMIPEKLADELRRLYTLDIHWLDVTLASDQRHAKGDFLARVKHHTPLNQLGLNGSDLFSLYAMSHWLGEGPKVYRPDYDLCRQLSQIEVSLKPREYAQPFPTILILTGDAFLPFTSCLCHYDTGRGFIVFDTTDGDITDGAGIVTPIFMGGDRHIEDALNVFEPDVTRHHEQCRDLMRAAANACLLMCGEQYRTEHLFKKEADRDARLVRRFAGTEKAARAESRLADNPIELITERHVKLYVTRGGTEQTGEPTGRHVRKHWRRAHWAVYRTGKGRTGIKYVLRPPVLVNKNRAGDDTVPTIYS